MKKDLLSLADLSSDELWHLLNVAQELKEEWQAGGNQPILTGKTLGMVFQKPSLRTRVERYFQFQALHLNRYREEIMHVARTLVDEGEIPRARVQEITGKGATVSAEIIKLGLNEDFFETPSPKGALQAAFPAKLHEFYFPQLFLDLPVEPPSGSAA